MVPWGRKRQAAMKTMTVMTTSGMLSSLLPNSIQVLSSVCPAFLLATMSAALHLGQSGQPSPDELSLTAAPVDMMTVSAMTPASAICRIDRGVGDSTGRRSLARGYGGGKPPRARGDPGGRPPGAMERARHYGRAPARCRWYAPR